MLDSRHSFTLIELLVVLAIVAILSTVVIMTLNPAELLKQARDSTRLSDLSTLNTALAAYNADVTNGFMGTSTVVYVSIPDTSPTCANLGLPALPTSTIVYTYNCVPATSSRLTNGLGWIPVNLSNISFGSPLSALPIDPINTTTSGQYYTYVSGGSFILTAIPESTKQKTALSQNPNIPNYPGVIAVGNNTSLSPLYNPTGLVGYWKFDEGSGAVAVDSSGNGREGAFSGNAAIWSSGKVGGALRFNQANQRVMFAMASTTSDPLSVSFWFNADSLNASYRDMVATANGDNGRFHLAPTNNQIMWYQSGGSNTVNSGIIPTPGQWYHVVGTYDGTGAKVYVNGVLAGSNPGPFSLSFSYMNVGNDSEVFSGLIDDVRYYSRVLSVAEVTALYNSTK